MSKTLVVHFYGGPGSGKSTCASMVFGHLKSQNINAEFVHEYAKDLTWEERHQTLRFQPYVTIKQLYHIHRVMGKVDVIISDSSILLGGIYRGEGYTNTFERYILETYKSWSTHNIFLLRGSKPYLQIGRTQTKQEAIDIDSSILSYLTDNGIDVETYETSHIMRNIPLISERIINAIY